MRRALGLAAALLLASGCTRPIRVPIKTEIHATRAYLETGGPPSGTVLLLPGIADRPPTFKKEGFVKALFEYDPRLVIVAADAHLGYYLKEVVAERLWTDVVSPIAARKGKLWIIGISLGGLGAVALAREHPEAVTGMFLVAPFLGTDEVIDEIRTAGGLARWSPAAPVVEYRKMWLWLKNETTPMAETGPARPLLYMGFGTEDRLGATHRLLAEALPPDHVLTRPGPHDWPVWRALLADFLGRRLL